MSSSDDMEEISAAIKERNQHARVHWWKKIEEINDKGIFELGEVIAAEIKFELEKLIAEGKWGKVIFIGHSMGGLVARAALEHLEDFKNYFYAFITFASPHFGYIHSKSNLLSIGIWAMSKVFKDPTVSEMRLSDATDINDWALYKLSLK